MSSKVRPPKARQVLAPQFRVKKVQSRDPRFDPSFEHEYRQTGSGASGTGGRLKSAQKSYYDPNYEHVHEMQREELKRLRQALRGENASKWTAQQRLDIQRQISVLNGMVTKQKRQKDRDEVKREFYAAEKAKVAAGGKKAYYLTDRQLDTMVKQKQYEELKKSGEGNLQKKLARIRKRNKSGQSALMPTSRRGGQE